MKSPGASRSPMATYPLEAWKGVMSRSLHATPDQLATLVRGMEKSLPSVFQMFYPRCYPEIGGYWSPKLLATLLASIVMEVSRAGLQQTPTAMQLLYPDLGCLVEKKVPAFFLAPKLLEAVLRSDFQGDIDWTTMPLPFEHGVLMLPKGGYRSATEGECAFIVWGRLRPGVVYQPPPYTGRHMTCCESLETQMHFVGFFPERLMWYDSNLTTKFRPTMQLRNLFYRGSADPIPSPWYGHDEHPLDDPLQSKEEVSTLEDLGVILFGTLLAMTAKPELLVKGKMLQTIPPKHTGDKPKQFWSPNIIGKNYQPKLERGTGTHASPRLHWRRGHFRHQPFGPQRKERKVIWLEPMLVGATTEK